MERQRHKGAFLLVEGGTDIKRFERAVDESACSFVNCFGKPNVMDAIERLYDDGFEGALGLIDADFDRLLDTIAAHEGLVVSQYHDFDLDASSSSCFERYMSEVSDTSKVNAQGGLRAVFDAVIAAIRPLSAMRFANVKHQLGYSLSRIDLHTVFDGRVLNVDALIDAVSHGRFSSQAAKAALRAYINKYAQSALDPMQLTSGHDFCAALGIVLRDLAGARRVAQTWRSEIELHFRLAYDQRDFAGTVPYSDIQTWEAANTPYRILRAA